MDLREPGGAGNVIVGHYARERMGEIMKGQIIEHSLWREGPEDA